MEFADIGRLETNAKTFKKAKKKQRSTQSPSIITLYGIANSPGQN